MALPAFASRRLITGTASGTPAAAASVLAGSPLASSLLTVMYDQIGMAFLLHGVVRANAGLDLKSSRALRLAQVSYAIEWLSFARLVATGVAPAKKCAAFLLLPILGILYVEGHRKKAAAEERRSAATGK